MLALNALIPTPINLVHVKTQSLVFSVTRPTANKTYTAWQLVFSYKPYSRKLLCVSLLIITETSNSEHDVKRQGRAAVGIGEHTGYRRTDKRKRLTSQAGKK